MNDVAGRLREWRERRCLVAISQPATGRRGIERQPRAFPALLNRCARIATELSLPCHCFLTQACYGFPGKLTYSLEWGNLGYGHQHVFSGDSPR